MQLSSIRSAGRARTFARYSRGMMVVIAAITAGRASADTLTWDSSGASPTAPTDGAGTWDTSTANWSNGTSDVDWTQGDAAVIGRGPASTKGGSFYFIAVQADISASSVTINNGVNSEYGITAYSPLTAPLIVESTTLVLNGTFITNSISGNSTSSIVIFDTVTLEPTTAITYPNSLISGTTNASGQPLLQMYQLSIDTSLVPSGVVTETDPLTSAVSSRSFDKGLTKNGTGTLVLGSDENGVDPAYTYTGPTTVNGGTLALDTSANTYYTSASTTGPFSTSGFVVNSGATLSVWSPDAIAGESGSTPVTINGGTLTTADISFNIGSAYLANVTLNGGTITSAADGDFIFLPGALFEVSASGTLSAVTAAFETAATVQVDPGAVLTVSSNLTDADTSGQITKTGTGTMLLEGTNNSFAGSTTVSAGTLTLAVGDVLSQSPSINVASGATFNLLGSTTNQPNLTVTGTTNLGANAGAGILTRKLNTLTLGTGGLVTVAAATNHVNRQLIVLGASGGTSLVFGGSSGAWQGQLDLSNNDLDLKNGNLANVFNQISEGYNGGAWNGSGIISSAAAGNTSHLTALGVILNNNGSGKTLYGSGATLGLFDGTSPAITDVLVKYTYYGDANLDGKVDGSDYTLIDAGFNSQSAANPLTGWYNGDFNYDGKVDGSDYTLIDNAFNTQTVNLDTAALFASSTSQFGGSAAVPEPATICLLQIGLLGILSRRRQRD